MRLYLDLCALKRPFDDAQHDRVVLETRAVLLILERIERGVDTLVWSTGRTLENEADSEPEPRIEVAEYASRAETVQSLTPQIERRAKALNAAGLRALDALHLAFAEAAGCDVLFTCDDRFVKRATRDVALIRVVNPIEYCNEMRDD
jgi:predicted nucleic acid-binding protein